MGQRPLVLMDGSSCHHGLDQREGAGVGGGRGQPGVPCLLGLHPSPFLPAVQHLAVCQCFLWCSLTATTKVIMGGSGLESDLTKVAVTNAEGGQSLTSACDFSSTYPPGASLRSCPYLLCAKYFQIQPGSHHPEASLYSGFLAMTPNGLVELAGIMTLQPLSSCFFIVVIVGKRKWIKCHVLYIALLSVQFSQLCIVEGGLTAPKQQLGKLRPTGQEDYQNHSCPLSLLVLLGKLSRSPTSAGD